MQRKTLYSLGLSLVLFVGCRTAYHLKQESTSPNQSVSEGLADDPALQTVIAPYKEKVDAKMNRVLAYSPIDLTKEGFNSPLANLSCDLVLEESQRVFKKPIDMCMLNHGGLRRNFSKGDLTVRNVYELMSFENQAVVVTLKGSDVLKIIDYCKQYKKGEPISNALITITDGKGTILIGGKPVDANKEYTIVTNDYLQKGGDKMTFFANPIKVENVGMTQRDLMLQYFERIDTVRVNTSERLIIQ